VHKEVPNTVFHDCVIVGKSLNGQTFRPSDWAERVCGHLATFRNRRIYYSSLLRPAVIDGTKCIIVNASLEKLHPKVYQMVMDFSRTNQLQVR